MDKADLRILDALQHDGRLTNQELAERIGLSASQCSRRRAALEEAGVIAGYHASLNAEAVGVGVIAFVQVTLAAHSPDASTRFHRLVNNTEAVIEAWALTGEFDYLVKLAARDLKELAQLLEEVFLPHTSVAHVRSAVALNRLKETSRLPLAPLATASKRPATGAKIKRKR